jgi:hypothetical protein
MVAVASHLFISQIIIYLSFLTMSIQSDKHQKVNSDTLQSLVFVFVGFQQNAYAQTTDKVKRFAIVSSYFLSTFVGGMPGG